MTTAEQIADIERRAFEARLTIAELCRRAGMSHQVWSRAKQKGSAHPLTVARMADKIADIEAERTQ